ncbi:Amidohydrolase [Novosphingobium sp. CF614]|uniref:amidohydrolase family protein n=1 Tax=Novosphingobium sp. CF614 TaxID=1884364 RepID=UPI0008E58535|nr:amidohydrolase family protein [Novosphingobium sp. CF614]SFF76894.1 Amidohydrolase [Novosphingobium sp. CF614]
MDIVDVQLHLGPGPVEPTLEAMDSLGIRSVLIEEFWIDEPGRGPQGGIKPGFSLPNGAWRAVYPVALRASILYPDRFGYVVRIDRRDPDLEGVMRLIAAEPGARGFRMLATWSMEEAQVLASGGYDEVFGIAQDIGLPICLFVPGHVEHLPQYLRKFPRLQFVLDHIGMGMPNHPPGRAEAEQARSMDVTYFDEVLRLAEFPNLAVKISHAPMLLRAGAFPFEAVRPHLRRAIDAFGADRLMWASDKTVMRRYTWAELLNYLLFDPEFSPDEKAWILGRTARRLFRWPEVSPQNAKNK